LAETLVILPLPLVLVSQLTHFVGGRRPRGVVAGEHHHVLAHLGPVAEHRERQAARNRQGRARNQGQAHAAQDQFAPPNQQAHLNTPSTPRVGAD
jgi:hypothetical protein